MPSTCSSSLIPIGTPARAPGSSPGAIRWSIGRSLSACAVEIDVDDRVQLFVVALDALDERLEDLFRGDLAAADAVGDLMRVQLPDRRPRVRA